MALLSAFGLGKDNKQLAVGSKAPGLILLNEENEKHDLGETLAQGLTLLYFYPKAHTPVCTAQACELRDNFSQLEKAGLRLLGVSRDKPDSLKRFREKHKIPFTLLSDNDGKLCKAFGVPLIFSVSLRQSFLIKDGYVVWRDLHPRVPHQSETVLAVIATLKS
jgi:thioredoxin-dependent peroxiredoxin